MYDRILQLLIERSPATRAKIAAMGGNAAFKQAAGDQKADPLAQRAAVAAKKAKVARVQSQGRSQPTVHIAGTSRKAARAAGQDLIGTTGGKGSKQPRIAEPRQGPEFPTGASSPANLSSPSRLSSPSQISNRLQSPSRLSSPANVPFNRTYRRVLGAMKKAKPALSMKMKGLDMGPVTNAFNVRNEPTTATVRQGGQKSREPDPRSETVKNLLKGLTGRKSMHNRPSYRP